MSEGTQLMIAKNRAAEAWRTSKYVSFSLVFALMGKSKG